MSATTANPRAVIGNNSRAAEIAELVNTLRIELETYEMTPLWRARWEMLIDQTMAAPDKLIGLIMSFFQEFRGRADPGVKMVEMLSGLADRRVRMGVKLNEDRGFLVKEKGGHRGQPSVFSVQIPEKTLRELGEWRHQRAGENGGTGGTSEPPLLQKGGIGGTLEPPMPPMPPFNGGTSVPPFSPYKDTNNNYPSYEEGEEGAREKPLVYANGTAFEGPGFKLDYQLVKLNGGMLGFSDQKSMLIGELIAWQWASTGFVPRSTPYAFQEAMALRKAFYASAENKLKIELDRLKSEQAIQKPPPTQQRGMNWHDANAERARRGKEAAFGGGSKS